MVFVRIHTLETTPEQFERGLAIVRDDLLPWAAESTGFRGLIGLADASRKSALVITLWEDEAALEASKAAGDELSALAANVTGATRRSLEDYEVTLLELRLKEN
jgi:hypothetical protein